jgi:hypothetical protein
MQEIKNKYSEGSFWLVACGFVGDGSPHTPVQENQMGDSPWKSCSSAYFPVDVACPLCPQYPYTRT